jgi:hypothetical protein
MSVAEMSKPLEKIKKLKGRSWEEIKTRGGQAFSGYSEQIGLSGNLPTDAEFYSLLDNTHFGGEKITAEMLLESFYQHSLTAFFPFAVFSARKAPDFLSKKPNELSTVNLICWAIWIWISARLWIGITSQFRANTRRSIIGSSLTSSTPRKRAIKKSSGN